MLCVRSISFLPAMVGFFQTLNVMLFNHDAFKLLWLFGGFLVLF